MRMIHKNAKLNLLSLPAQLGDWTRSAQNKPLSSKEKYVVGNMYKNRELFLSARRYLVPVPGTKGTHKAKVVIS